MFPPQKPKPKPKPGGDSPPIGGSSGGQGDPSAPPMGAGPPPPPPGPPPGMENPGQGMDPMMAMMGGLGGGMGAPPPPPFPAGPGGLPVGGSFPQGTPEEMGETDGSPLLQALMASQDPYGVAPGESEHALDGGMGDPHMGLDQILQMLAMAQMGVGGSPDSGLDMPGGGGFGTMQGY